MKRTALRADILFWLSGENPMFTISNTLICAIFLIFATGITSGRRCVTLESYYSIHQWIPTFVVSLYHNA